MVMLHDGKKLEFPGKFDVIWFGPYWIMKVYPNNIVQLATLEYCMGPTFPHTQTVKAAKSIICYKASPMERHMPASFETLGLMHFHKCPVDG